MAEDPRARRTQRTNPGAGRVGQAHRSGAAAARPPGTRSRRTASRRRGRSLIRRLGRIDPRRYVAALGPALRRALGGLLAPHRPRTVRLALPPVATAADIAAMLDTITAAVRRGSITPGEAAALAEVADSYIGTIRALEASEFDRRLRLLEAAHAAKA